MHKQTAPFDSCWDCIFSSRRCSVRAMSRTAIFAALLFNLVLGCESSPLPSTQPDLAALTDLADRVDLTDRADLQAPPDPASCAVKSAQELFPGAGPPIRFEDLPLADACLEKPHDAIIVLGCPSKDSGAASDCQVARADIAAALYHAGFGRYLITSGGAVKNRFVEAEALRDLLIARGVKKTAIHLEPRAEHTDENIYYSTKIMEAEGSRTALLVSDDPGHFVFVAVCDSNCCVDLGRLTPMRMMITLPGKPEKSVVVGHYVRYPFASQVSTAECAHLKTPTKFMCINLSSRRACAGHISLPN